jgi:DNA-binding NtrC family response regulator
MDVLVVENDASVLSYIVGLIQQWGHNAEKSETGRDTIKKVKEKIYDLVLLDTSIHDMTAQVLIAKLKELRPDIKIVTMTESNTGEMEKEIRTLGIVYYMSKPVSEGVLKDILDHISMKKDRMVGQDEATVSDQRSAP